MELSRKEIEKRIKESERLEVLSDKLLDILKTTVDIDQGLFGLKRFLMEGLVEIKDYSDQDIDIVTLVYNDGERYSIHNDCPEWDDLNYIYEDRKQRIDKK